MICASLTPLLTIQCLSLGSEQNDIYFALQRLVIFYFCTDLHTVHLRHHYIEENEAGLLGTNECQSCFAIICEQEFYTFILEVLQRLLQ